MSKNDFIAQLCMKLRSTPAEEAQRTVLFYAEAIDDRMEDGMTEEEAVAAMGSIDDIVREFTLSCFEDTSRDEEAPQSGSEDVGTIHRTFSPLGVERIEIYETSGDIELLPSPDGLIHVEYTATKAWRYNITQGSTIAIRRTRNSVGTEMNFDLFGYKFTLPNMDFSGIFGDELSLTLRLPEGNLFVGADVASGDVNAQRLRLGGLSVKSASGDVELTQISSAGNIGLITASGDVEIRHAACPELSAATASGDIELTGVQSPVLRLKTASGDIEVAETVVSERLSAASVSGDLELELAAPCLRIKLESVSGDVNCTLPGKPEDYAITAKSGSGDVNVPEGAVSGPYLVQAKTLSGDIDLDIFG